MKTFKLLLLLAGASLIGAGAQAVSGPQMEHLLGFEYGPEGLTFQVNSGGCSNKDSFVLIQKESYPLGVSLKRIRPDFCDAYLPFGTKLTYTWEELGWSTGEVRFIIENPLVSEYRIQR